MKKKLIKNLLLVLTLVVLCFAVGVTASALEATGQCGDNAYWQFDETTGELIVSGEGEMWDYPAIGKYSDKSNIKLVRIEEGITTIGNSAFMYCANLTEVELPKTLEIIGEQAFCYCESIVDLKIPNQVKEIKRCAFDECEKLEAIEIPDSVIKIGEYAFANCVSAKKLIVGDNVSNIEDSAFGWCFSLTEIHIGKSVNISSINDTYGIIICSYNLENITVDEENPYFCVDDKGVLYTKDKSRLVIYPSAKPYTTYVVDEKTTEIAPLAFVDCLYLEELILPDGLKKIGEGAFAFSSSFKMITLPITVEYIGPMAFYNLFGLEKLIIGGLDIEISDMCFETEVLIKEEDIEFFKEFFINPEPSEEMLEKFNTSLSNPDESICLFDFYCHAGSTAEAYAIGNGVDYVLTHFYEDEWTYDYDNMIRFRKCIHCDVTETEALEPTTPDEPTVPDEPITPDEPQEETKDSFFSKLIDLIKAFFELIASMFKK